ncbi:MAG: TonB-dependent receptor [Acidobacteria bacterium]|nr:TonB-dependent receptor [Acidobacteriota bacterium]
MLIACVFAITTGAWAQATGRVTGTVQDPQSLVVPGVTVTLTSSTGALRTTVTDTEGRYVFENVTPGAYTVSFELPGFTAQTTKVTVAAGETATTETRLELGGQSEAIQVTGTLIPRPMIESPSPVVSLDVQEIQSRGLTRVEDLLITVPQVYSTNFGHSSQANGASGTAGADLRYLGAARTKVLIDGRVMMPGDALDEDFVAADLNFIPSFLVRRVDVLTGGASSVYGADAVAGVINFVLDREFTGVKGGVNWAGYQHNNDNELARSINAARGFTVPQGSVWNRAPANFNVALGANFDQQRGHATVYLDYRDTPAITKDQRDYTNCSVQNLGSTGAQCSGSGTWQNGRFLVLRKPGTTGPASGDFVLDVNAPGGNQFRRRTGTDVYNFAPHNFMQRPDKKWLGGGFMNYQWNRYAEAYADVMFMDDRTDAQIAPSGDFGNTDELNCNNPMLSAQQRQLLCTDMGYGPNDLATVIIFRRNVEGGGRVAQIRHTALRFNFGMRGDINDAWRYDAYGLQGQVQSPQSYANDLHVDRLQDALIVDGDPNNPASWRCRSGNTGCVPWNIFSVGGVTQQALQYLQLPLILDSGTRTRTVIGTLTGNLGNYGLQLPSADEGVRLAFGSGYRQESLFVNPDLSYRLALGSGQGGPTLPVDGDYDVREVFVEGLVPLVQGRRGAQDLSVELGYRFSDYSTTGGAPTYKTSASWAPVNDVRVRAGYNRATRSPNVVELFTPQGLGLGGSQDICAGTRPTGTVQQCERLGVPASLYGTILENPAGQYNTLDGGNPILEQEIANTVTAGVVVTPRAFTGFSATVDFFNVKVEDTIGSFDADDIMNQCAATGNPLLCNLINRDRFFSLWITTDGSDGYTITTNQNIGELEARGLDVNTSYIRALGGAGTLTTTLAGTILLNQKTNTGLFAYDCLGFHGNQCGIPTPRWRHTVRFAWDTTFNTTFAANWRFIGSTENDDLSDNPALGDPANVRTLELAFADKIEAFNYLDLSATYRVQRNYNIVAGINNVLDKEPPLGAGLSDIDFGPGFYGMYDHLGRFFFTGVQFQF